MLAQHQIGGRERAAEAINLNRCSDILELFPAESLHLIVLSQASRRLWSDENFTGFGNISQTGHQVSDGTAGRERPPRPTYALKTGRTDQSDTGVKAHMYGEWLYGIVSVEGLSGGEEREDGISNAASMLRILKDSHEAIAGSFIDITAGSMDEIEKRGKIAFNQGIEALRGQALAQAGVATDVEKQDGDVALALGEFGRFGIGCHQAFDGLWHELGEVLFDATQLPKFSVYRGFQPQCGVETGPEFPVVDRFGEKIIGPGFDPFDAVFNIPQSRHHHDGNEAGLLVFFQDATDRKAIHERHHHVEENQIRVFCSDLR